MKAPSLKYPQTRLNFADSVICIAAIASFNHLGLPAHRMIMRHQSFYDKVKIVRKKYRRVNENVMLGI